MSVCGVCGRQVETSESGTPMPCVPECLNRNRRPLDAFLAYAVDTCVNPERYVTDEDTTVDMSDLVGD